MHFSAEPMVIPASQILVISASVGAGHDGAARELRDRLRHDGFEVACLDFLDLLPRGLGRVMRAAYEWQLRRVPGSWGWLLDELQRHRLLSWVAARLTASVAGGRVRRAVTAASAGLVGPAPAGRRFDAVLSTYPLASQVLGRLRRSGQINVPVITFLTDMSVHRLWVADGVDAHLALHAVAAAQAQQFGAQGVQVGGPAVSPQFRPVQSRSEQDVLRHRFGLPMGTPLALVVAGSWGVGDIESTVDDIARCGVATPVVACGHNDELYRRLKQAGTAIPVGWTDEMACLVRACDVVVQNAGGLSSLEARACGLPVLTYRCLPGHGQTNAAALDEAGWALWIQTPEELRTALKSAVVGELSGSFGNRRLGRTATAAELSVDPAVAIAALVPARVGVPRVSCG